MCSLLLINKCNLEFMDLLIIMKRHLVKMYESWSSKLKIDERSEDWFYIMWRKMNIVYLWQNNKLIIVHIHIDTTQNSYLF